MKRSPSKPGAGPITRARQARQTKANDIAPPSERTNAQARYLSLGGARREAAVWEGPGRANHGRGTAGKKCPLTPFERWWKRLSPAGMSTHWNIEGPHDSSGTAWPFRRQKSWPRSPRLDRSAAVRQQEEQEPPASGTEASPSRHTIMGVCSYRTQVIHCFLVALHC